MAGTVDSWQLGAGFIMQRPRNLGAVGDQMVQLERQINTFPFPAMGTSELGLAATVTNVVGAVTGFRHRVRPTRVGQLAIAFAWVQAVRTAGAADLQLHFRVQDGSGTPVAKIQTLTSTAAILTGLLFTAHDMRSTREHTFQVYGVTGAAGTTWNVIAGSSVTVFTV